MSTSNSWYEKSIITIQINYYYHHNSIILRYPPVIKRGSGKLPIHGGIFQLSTFDCQGYILDTCLNSI